MEFYLSRFAAILLYATLIIGPVFAYGILIRPKNDTLTGIQGWLAWLATGQVLSLLYNAVTLWLDREGVLNGLGGDLLLYALVPLRVANFLAQVITTYALFARKSCFSTCFLAQSVISVAF